MREPAQAKVTSGMGTQEANNHSNEPVWINEETDQNEQNYMETAQAHQ